MLAWELVPAISKTAKLFPGFRVAEVAALISLEFS
jgi:hypothetical protein